MLRHRIRKDFRNTEGIRDAFKTLATKWKYYIKRVASEHGIDSHLKLLTTL